MATVKQSILLRKVTKQEKGPNTSATVILAADVLVVDPQPILSEQLGKTYIKWG